jgi:hypothetical protein
MIAKQLEKKEPFFDAANSELVLSIYHQNYWTNQSGQPTNMAKSYLRMKSWTKNQDFEPDPDEMFERELSQASRVVENKCQNANSRNPMTCIMLYHNDNRGGTQRVDYEGRAINNRLICQLDIRPHGYGRSIKIAAYAQNPETAAQLNALMDNWQWYIDKYQKGR